MRQSLSFLALLLLVGCIQQLPPPMTVGTLAPGTAPKNTAIISGPSFTSLSTEMPIKTPSISVTPTRESSSTTFSPTNTHTPSLYQEIRTLPKGPYILLKGRNGNEPGYVYVMITETGQIAKKFELSEYVLGFSNDFRYFVYQSNLPFNNKWVDMNDARTSHPLIDGCNQPAWSKDISLLSMLCLDGIHFFELRDGNWIEKATIARPDELKSVPEEYNEDIIFLKYPLWMQNGFAFFVDYSGLIYGGSVRAPQNLYFLGKECIDDSRMCDLSKPTMAIAGGSPPVTAAAMSPDDRLLAVVVADNAMREIRVYDFLSQKVVQRFDLRKVEQNQVRSTVDSMVWVDHANRLLFSMTDPQQIVGIDNSNKFEVLFNCSDHKIFDCSILSTVTIP